MPNNGTACIPPGDVPYSLRKSAIEAAAIRHMGWKMLLAYITGSVDQELRAIVARKERDCKPSPAGISKVYRRWS
jgi:hypothetical protein